jgi:hypothetical protein
MFDEPSPLLKAKAATDHLPEATFALGIVGASLTYPEDGPKHELRLTGRRNVSFDGLDRGVNFPERFETWSWQSRDRDSESTDFAE